MKTPKPHRRRSSSDLQAVQVFCRVKPRPDNEPSCLEIVDKRTIKTTGSRIGAHKQTLHTFTNVFNDEVGQEEIFHNVALPLVSDLLEGKNGLLLTYGVTGSGKTYSLVGNKKEAGILPLALDVVFNSIGDKQTKKYVVKPDGLNGFELQSESDAIMDRHRLDYQQRLRLPRYAGNQTFIFPRSDLPSTAMVSRPCLSTTLPVVSKALFAVFISLVEVYNNNVYDLLQEVPDAPGRVLTSHILREDAQRNVYVSGSIEVEVKTTDDALRVFTTGLKRRRVGQTALNSESSRSHCIFTVRLVRTGYDEKYNEAIEDKNLLVVSQLCLVDLAGSERAHRAGTQGDRLKEASSINSSLMNLRKCIEMLREIQHSGQWAQGLATPGGTNRVVPYRDKRLTHLFKNFFEGNGRVVMLICVHQSVDDYDETMHVLRFAESSQEVSTFRTPGIPAPSPAPASQRRRCADVYRNSGRSTETTSTTMSIPWNVENWFARIEYMLLIHFAVRMLVDDQIPTLLAELNDFDAHVDHCLTRLLSSIGQCSESSDFSSDAVSDPKIWTDEPEQDSAPENDRVLKRTQDSGHFPINLSNISLKIDTEPLRALLTQRMDAHQRCYIAFEQEWNAFRMQLTDLVNSESLSTIHSRDLNEKSRLEARIRQLEGQLVEGTTTAKQERAERLRQKEESRLESDRLRAIIERLNGKRLQDERRASNRLMRKACRPSTGNTNLVSILSKQWENRLAEQQQGEKIHPSTRVNKASRQKISDSEISTTPSSVASQRRVAAFNPRHRRSRSVGGDTSRWLEHQETNAVPLGTVFTPKVNRRKSVTQIELKDTLNATNYVLHHQEADSDGNVETRLFKARGSIIPTAGGGSAVIFDDVEELKQCSPNKSLGWVFIQKTFPRGFDHLLFINKRMYLMISRNSCTARRRSSRLAASRGESQSFEQQTSPDEKSRKSMKRHRSPSVVARESGSSTGTHSSQSSAQTASSSSYEPFGAPLSPPLMSNRMDSATLNDRIQIGIHSSGGMGSFGPVVGKNSRKCPRK
ncbi:Kinesin protein [Fasciola gigantica]|uniref:Kinesin protein n=1 Tax=Fasciola gigantica TaxID=46835 RepID=A0A504Z414_FASGI|nr:Kinesin protein [Fasciola gigantica]